MARDLLLVLKLNAGKAAADMRRFVGGATNDLNRLSRSTRQLSRDFQGFTTQTKLLAGAFGIISGRAVLGGMIELERAMLRVESNLVGGAKSAADLQGQLQAVRDTAREVSKVTIFSDVDAINATNQLLKSGINPDVVHGKSGVTMNALALAQLGDVTPDAAASFLGASGNAFNFKSKKDYRDFTNHMIKADDASAMNSAQIMYNMKQTGATASALHIDPKRTVSMLAYLDTLGDEAGTAVNRLLENLAAPTRQKNKWMKKSGFQFWETGKDGKTHLKDIGDVIEIIRQKFKNMKSDKDKQVFGSRLFGEEGKRAAEFFTHKDFSFQQFEDKVEKATGFEEKLRIQAQGLGNAFERLKNSTMRAINDEGTPVMRGLTSGTNTMTNLIDKGHGGELLGGVAAVGGLLAAGKINKAMKGRAAARIAAAAADKAANAKEKLDRAAKEAHVQKVFVTNWPKSMLGPGEQVKKKLKDNELAPGANAGGESSPNAKKQSKLSKAGNGLAQAGAAFMGWEIGQAAGDAIKEVIDSGLQVATHNQEITLGSWLYDKFNEPIKVEPIQVQVDVKNGNIVAEVKRQNEKEARRH